MQVKIIGNCQVVGMRDVISAALSNVEVKEFEVWNKTSYEIENFAKDLKASDLVISQPLHGHRYSVLANAIEDCPDRLYIHNLFWDATAPDSRYVGQPDRVKSPIMNYHSDTVLKCFLEGRPEVEAVARLGQFDKASVLDAFERNVAAFRQREELVDVPFMDELIEEVRQSHSFHVFNHPTISLIHAYVQKIFTKRFPGLFVPKVQFEDRLRPMGAFAVYESVSEHLGLTYAHNHFLVPAGAGLIVMGFEEFVGRSYEIYAAQPPGRLR